MEETNRRERDQSITNFDGETGEVHNCTEPNMLVLENKIKSRGKKKKKKKETGWWWWGSGEGEGGGGLKKTTRRA